MDEDFASTGAALDNCDRDVRRDEIAKKMWDDY